MSTASESAILLIGLTGTGKTNYLVALDVILDEQTDPDGLIHSDFASDRAYVQPLREQWLRGEELDHTSRLNVPPPHQLLVKHPASGTDATFYVPDLAGETFDEDFVTRSFSREFGTRLQNCAGVLLFLHCDHDSDHAIHEDETFTDASTTSTEESATNAHGSEWRLEDAAKQVKLVDLFQFIADIALSQTALNVAVVVSAWDRVEAAPDHLNNEMPKDPLRFFPRRWPLLAQFFEGNQRYFSTKVFGVSARGGGSDPEDIARLTSFSNPRDRILMVDGTSRSSDLTRPVRWLLGLL